MEQKYYRIGEFSLMTELSIPTLRYYDAINLLNPSYVDPESNYRYYTESDLEKVKQINNLKEAGFSIEEMIDIVNNGLTMEKLQEKEDELYTQKYDIDMKLNQISDMRIDLRKQLGPVKRLSLMDKKNVA